MHQPIYWPYENVVDTANKGIYGYNLIQIFTDRAGPYTKWPIDAVQSGMKEGFQHFGAQISFTGSLIENLNNLWFSGVAFQNWNTLWKESQSWKTSFNNKRVEFVNIGYHHPLMGLIDEIDIILQIEMHRFIVKEYIGAGDSKGIFPPEAAFTERMIPSLVKAGIEWVIVDNIHFDRSHIDYPYVPQSNLYPPNPSDQINDVETAWIKLDGLWAPSKVSAPWGYQPHYVQYIDPETAIPYKIIAVPAARYEGNEDGKGGFGALLYEKVFSQYEDKNIDEKHPMLILLHHDGDNHGGGKEEYYHGNFNQFINWLKENPQRFECTTIQDYLQMFPPAENDVIHVENGAWSGADNGDPEFLKWNGDPDNSGYSPDRVSWAVITAARNRVQTAEKIKPHSTAGAIIKGNGNETDKAWHYLLNGETSCYWYWDNSEKGIWDSHPARAANMAFEWADKVINLSSDDKVPPTVYIPQREPYNPDGFEWGNKKMPKELKIITLAYDVSGVKDVILWVRIDCDGKLSKNNMTYKSGAWNSIPMDAKKLFPKTDPKPKYIAELYEAMLIPMENTIYDYYVEVYDNKGNLQKTPIQHVYIGIKNGKEDKKLWSPVNPTSEDKITIYSEKEGFLHWGVNGWTMPDKIYWTDDTIPYGDGKSVETPLKKENDKFITKLGPFNSQKQIVESIDFVFHFKDGKWSSPDQKIMIKKTDKVIFCNEKEEEIIQPPVEEVKEEIIEKVEESYEIITSDILDIFEDDVDKFNKYDTIIPEDLKDNGIAKDIIEGKKEKKSSGCSMRYSGHNNSFIFLLLLIITFLLFLRKKFEAGL